MKVIDTSMLSGLTDAAQSAARKRTNLNFHQSSDEAVQRLLIAMEPGSYVRPHRHLDARKWELFIVLQGELVALFFDDLGRVEQRLQLSSSGSVRGFEIPPGVWHCTVALAPGTVFAEVKQGPYVPTCDKDFAAWAPPEGDARCARFLKWFETAEVGARPPAAT